MYELKERIHNNKSFTIFTPNPEILVRAKIEKKFAEILQSNDVNIPDGVGISLFTGIPTIKGRVLMEDILKLLNENKLSAYFIGSHSDVIEKVLVKINNIFSEINAKGLAGPFLNEQGISIDNEQALIQQKVEHELKQYKPTVVFVAFGAPKQEYWVTLMKKKFPHISWMVVGGALDTYSGVKSLPPSWLQTIKLEWLFRLVQEPQRLGRIINAVIVFPLLVLFSKLRKND